MGQKRKDFPSRAREMTIQVLVLDRHVRQALAGSVNRGSIAIEFLF